MKLEKTATYAETVAAHFKGKLVEIYFGDAHEQLTFSESNLNVGSTIIGRIIDASGECIVLDCYYVKHNELKTGNTVLVNTYNISFLTELNGQGTIRDLLQSVGTSAKFQPGGKFGNAK